MIAMKANKGLPDWVPLSCLPVVDTPLAVAYPLGAATPDMVADAAALKGLVVYLHGLSDGPPSLAHLFEELAGVGFICAAPSFTDDDSNSVDSVLTGGHQNLRLLHTHRIERTRTAISALQQTYGSSLPLMLIGYSTGADSIRIMQETCPRIYIGGPGWLEAITKEPITEPPPGGATLQLLAVPDPTMTSMGFSEAEASSAVGVAQVVLPAGEAATALAAGTQHVRVDFNGWQHGSFKHPPFEAMELNAWNSIVCGFDFWALVEKFMGSGSAEEGGATLTTEERASYTGVVANWLLTAASLKT